MWLCNGDINSTFFQNRASLNKHKNSIFQILDPQGNIQVDRENIEKVFLDHFESLWKDPDKTSFFNLTLSLPHDLPIISNDNSEYLIRRVTKAEIFKIVKSLTSGKSLGPDGFNVDFYKFFWHDIQDDLSKAINHFFEIAHMPNSWGLTYIALIPKKENPKSDTDYCPISLCNVYYKIIAKILSNRL